MTLIRLARRRDLAGVVKVPNHIILRGKWAKIPLKRGVGLP